MLLQYGKKSAGLLFYFEPTCKTHVMRYSEEMELAKEVACVKSAPINIAFFMAESR